jgi:hypothetical protein
MGRGTIRRMVEGKWRKIAFGDSPPPSSTVPLPKTSLGRNEKKRREK